MTDEKIISGFVDHLEGGYVTGWAAVVSDNSPLEIAAFSEEGEFLGKAIANKFRPDLKENNINEGYHGFRMKLNHDLLLQAKKIELREFKSNQPLNIANIWVEQPECLVHISIVHLVNNKLDFVATSNFADWKKTLTFMVGDETIGVVKVESVSDVFYGHIWLPAKYLDNKQHMVECRCPGEPMLIGCGVIKGDSILTPMDLLSHSYNQPGLISKPLNADGRYESLTLQLANIEQSALNVQDITTVHNVLIEGGDKRKSFPKFSLPKYTKPLVSIIVPAYNKFAMTFHCIASIALSYNRVSYEVILADDCSEDETLYAEKYIDNLVISRNKENLRFLRSCNAASKKAKGDYIVFLNNDTEVTSFWLDELIAQHEKDASVGLTGSKLLNSDGTLQEAGGIVWGNGEPWNVGRNASPYAPEWNYVRQVDYVTGAAMCIKKSIWQEVGQFSEEFVPCYYEDVDLAFKVAEAGYKVLYVPHSEVTHLEGQSHGTDISKGLKRYQAVNESTFRRKWFSVFMHYHKPDSNKLLVEKDRKAEQRILVIDYATPMMGIDAGSYAAIQEIKLMIALGFKVTFVPENLAYMGKYTKTLQNLGVEVLLAPFYYSLQHILDTRLEEMDAVYITRYDVAKKYIDDIKAKRKPILFNNADLHFLREMRAAIAAKDQELIDSALLTREAELKVCEEVDAVLTYNTTEQAVITSHTLISEKLHLTPWVLEPKSSGPSYKQRQGIAFLGGYNHKPNIEAVEFMVEKVMPLLLIQRPDIKFYVYGSKMPESFDDYEADNVVIKGFTETLDGVYHDHRIFVAPLLSGAGIKGKVLDAMAYATPAILTDVAGEGTGLTNGINTLIANDSQEWVEAIIKLYDDQKLWQRFAENSLTLAKENFSFENGVNRFKKIFESVGVFSSKH
ncbi:glycosyltransferase [uncultured Paraglaciecola sp.]|uniref:glycosyltransferase n=1 Tax=uncultured Paraglaciecola sp. TaxID=1765024 RepID=UPI0025961FE1|nr:glycosyltransferase [uncultured Paraglaciecola sp.]